MFQPCLSCALIEVQVYVMISSELKGNSLRTNWGTKMKPEGSSPISMESSTAYGEACSFYFLRVEASVQDFPEIGSSATDRPKNHLRLKIRGSGTCPRYNKSECVWQVAGISISKSFQVIHTLTLENHLRPVLCKNSFQGSIRSKLFS